MWYVFSLNWIQRQDNFDMVNGHIVLTVRVLYHTLNVRGHSVKDEMAYGYTFSILKVSVQWTYIENYKLRLFVVRPIVNLLLWFRRRSLIVVRCVTSSCWSGSGTTDDVKAKNWRDSGSTLSCTLHDTLLHREICSVCFFISSTVKHWTSHRLHLASHFH